jgi:hypothetical protein
MKIAWTILIISAFTDFIITGGTALGTAMVATKDASMPSAPAMLLAGIGGIVAAARTIQQALKAAQSPETVEKLTPNG